MLSVSAAIQAAWCETAGRRKEARSLGEPAKSDNLVMLFVLQAPDIELVSPALVKTSQPEQVKPKAELGWWSLGWRLTLPGLCLLANVRVILAQLQARFWS